MFSWVEAVEMMPCGDKKADCHCCLLAIDKRLLKVSCTSLPLNTPA